jgi:hypothetical protein
MAAHGNTTFTGPETPEALLAERQKFWNGFTCATTVSIVATAAILIAMAVFLL